jgi:xanthine dehydrogenase large subunit
MRNLPELNNNAATTLSGQVGQSQKHESADRHVAGSAIYVDDQPAPHNTLHAYVGMSTVARGKITRLNLDAVRAADGVINTGRYCRPQRYRSGLSRRPDNG